MKKEHTEHLSEKEYEVCVNQGTEGPFSGEYDKFFEDGDYFSTCCHKKLFNSENKFDPGCGWPSFDRCEEKAIEEVEDNSHGMKRIEVTCSNCGSHLGHVFPDGPTDTGLRYCINSVSITFEKTDR